MFGKFEVLQEKKTAKLKMFFMEPKKSSTKKSIFFLAEILEISFWKGCKERVKSGFDLNSSSEPSTKEKI